MIQSTDQVAIKQFYNTHQEDIKKEVEYVQKKLDPVIKTQSLNRLQKKVDVLEQCKANTFKSFNDCEKFVEQTLGIAEKDFKKHIIFNLILTKTKQLSEISLSGMIETLKKEGKYPEHNSIASGGEDNDEQTG